ncbi:Sec-independent protein translocase protein TatB [Chromohalobacter israelensis]|uniref:Sec-independent protein translocase protein TatB n=1 Tax=Chromohalobacter israelensis (strain ATCC BAA-138 / DSM 3043 / CIP 106854 / NCIMB 13768 / 1H11) TaxID=290398 RepID=TATB_CHRI1|nr:MULTISPECIES: Sec-independent protein translocase protein TatB [Chromohalobacter]Q1R004.1 RecName: Full=Sec-independent protein translocase protein TatB [Chromohalobacter salexigens DSM 3043]ABE57954.1 Sec-independent protein translocase TatB [Chromohalobacter salexigens DSM 3043]MDF9433827.1 Sec-independent protein translocase protein TatB [Chromohalobacter israelensis]NWO57207.1 twin-arginine translocase subunit TatB [Chromohalobacter salexigens]
MFDMGFLELMLIGVVALLVLGPERLPTAARTVGLWVGKIKRTVSGMQREISAQLEAEELRQKLNEQQRKLDAGLGKVRDEVERHGDAPSSRGGQPPPSRTTPTAARSADDTDETPPSTAASRETPEPPAAPSAKDSNAP